MKQINLYLRINTLFSYLLGKLLIPRFLTNVSELLLTPSPKNTLVKYFKEMKAHNFRVAALAMVFFIGNIANVMAQPQCTPNIISVDTITFSEDTTITICARTKVTQGIFGRAVASPPVVTIRWEYRLSTTSVYTPIKTADAPFVNITASESLTAAELGSVIGSTVGEFRVRRTVISPSTNCTESSKEVIVTVVPYPVFTFVNVPGDIVISCFDKIPVGMFLAATNGTTASCTVGAGATSVITGAAEGTCGGTVTETWTYTDMAGRTITASRNITRTPAALGVITNAPANDSTGRVCGTELNGSVLEKVGSVCQSGYRTNLSTFSEEPGYSIRCGGFKRETWAGIDSCGGVMAPVSRLIYFLPAPKPTLAAAPANIVVTGKNVATSLLAYNNGIFGACQVRGEVRSTLQGTLDPICGGNMTEVWKYTDPCDNTVQTVSRIIRILPACIPTFRDEAGVIIPLPFTGDLSSLTATTVTLPTKTVDCGEAATSSITYTNASCYAPLDAGNCLVAGVISSTIGAIPDKCGGNYTETWKYFLPCPAGNNNFITFTRENTVKPAKAPVFADIEPITIEMDSVRSQLRRTDSLSYTNGETGNCLISGKVRKSGTLGDYIYNNAYISCGFSYNEKWSFIDPCGRTVEKLRRVTVKPARKPEFLPVSDIIVKCDSLVSPQALSYTNYKNYAEAQNLNYAYGYISGTVLSTLSAQSPLGNCGGTRVETWTATDVCGNVITATRNITVLPAEIPKILNIPVGIALPCGFNPAQLAPRKLNYSNGKTGDCLLTGETAWSTFTAIPDACGGTVTETFTATDACGRVVTAAVLHTVQPAALPIMVAPANDSTGTDCGTTVLVGSTLPFKNNLTGACAISGTSMVSTFAPSAPLTACSAADGYWMTETWTGVDCAGRPLIQVSRQVWRKPAMKPVMEVLPEYTVECNPSTVTTYTMTTSTSGTVTTTVTTAVPPALMPLKGIRFSNGLTGACKLEGVTIVNSTFSAQVPAGSCGGTIVEMFTYDYCGQTVTGTRNIIVKPAPLPVLLAVDNPILRINGIVDLKKDTTFACGSNINALLPLTFMGFSNNPVPTTFACDISGVSSNKSTRTAYTPNACGGTIIETWTAVDGCNRPLQSYSRTITILPAALAIMTAQPDLELECLPKPSKLPFTNSFLGACGSSGMSDMSTIVREMEVSPIHTAGCNNGRWIETWTAKDACGRTLAPVKRILIINDVTPPTSVAGNTGPVFDNTRSRNRLPDLTFGCVSDTLGRSASPLDIKDAVDNCDSLVVVSVFSVTNYFNQDNSWWYQYRYYQLTDRCNNKSFVGQFVYINDTVKPVITKIVPNRTVTGTKLNGDCTYIMPDFRSELGVTDNSCKPRITQSPAPGSLVVNNDRTLVDQAGNLTVEFSVTDGRTGVVTSSFVLNITCPTALAVNLASFDGVKTGKNESTLTWVTSSEVDFKEFQIQKSSDAVNFEGIGTVSGTAKQVSNLITYQFVDKNSVDVNNYYRLKMIDKDGSFDFSKIISIDGNEDANVVGQFYPNPTSGNNVSIDIYAKEAGVWKIESIDMLGRSVSTTEANLNKGANKVEVNVSTFNYGLNLIKLGSKSGSFTRKMFKN